MKTGWLPGCIDYAENIYEPTHEHTLYCEVIAEAMEDDRKSRTMPGDHTCPWCDAPKDNPNGMCGKCKRFSSPSPEELVRDNPVTFSQYLRLVVLAKEANPSWRTGQTYFNVLDNVRPDLADKICGTAIDPFHRDCVLAAFLGQISTMWNK